MSDDLIICKWLNGMYAISAYVGDYELFLELDDGYTKPDDPEKNVGLFVYYNGMDVTDSFIKLTGTNIRPTTKNFHRLLEVVTAHVEENELLADTEGGIT